MLAIFLIIVGIILRFIPHAPNFTPVAAIALFSGAYLSRRHAVLIPLTLMAVSDLFLGGHDVMIFTWSGIALVSLFGFLLREKKGLLRVSLFSVASSIIFFLISNFGVWLQGWYPRNLNGLIQCYVMALPFLRNFTMGTLSYSFVFFGIYELALAKAKQFKLAKIFLTI